MPPSGKGVCPPGIPRGLEPRPQMRNRPCAGGILEVVMRLRSMSASALLVRWLPYSIPERLTSRA